MSKDSRVSVFAVSTPGLNTHKGRARSGPDQEVGEALVLHTDAGGAVLSQEPQAARGQILEDQGVDGKMRIGKGQLGDVPPQLLESVRKQGAFQLIGAEGLGPVKADGVAR